MVVSIEPGVYKAGNMESGLKIYVVGGMRIGNGVWSIHEI